MYSELLTSETLSYRNVYVFILRELADTVFKPVLLLLKERMTRYGMVINQFYPSFTIDATKNLV
jgi:hypothetical protein